MMLRLLPSAVLMATVTLPAHQACAAFSPRSGAYQITVHLELPHLERWAVDKMTTICLPSLRNGSEIPVPVLSTNNPFAKCTAINFTTDGSTLQYDIVCPERGAAHAHASYMLSPDEFSGRIAMVMGAKNMTMTEVQHARRVGDCSPAALGPASSF